MTLELELMKGYVQIYTGNGKGKTTAALGLALRAAGAGLKVFIAQFLKGIPSSEIESLKKFEDTITIRQYGQGRFISDTVTRDDIARARKGLEEVKHIISEGDHHLVILDEAAVAIHFKLFSTEELLGIIKSKPQHVELVITGRYADSQLIDTADLVTEMHEIKHYSHKGIKARKGIEL